MASAATNVQAMEDHRLKICFANGSEAIIDMSRRVHAIRFCKLADPVLFRSAELESDNVVWRGGEEQVRATINELLDGMLLI